MPPIDPHVPNHIYISNDIILDENTSTNSKNHYVSSSDDSSVASMPRLFARDDLLDYATVSSSDISLPFHIFNVDCDSNKEDDNFIDDNLPLPDYVSIVTLVLEPHHYDDQYALIVHFHPTENKNQPIKPKTFIFAL